jgi:transposase-like protein
MTDQDKAMKNAIARVFPETRHRYCRWHIMRKLPEKFGTHANFDAIRRALNTCINDCQTCENLRKIGKFYLRVIIFKIMHGCRDYIVR